MYWTNTKRMFRFQRPGRDRRLRRGRDEDPVVRVTITTSKSRKRRALVAKPKTVVYSSPYTQLVVVTPRRPEDPRRPVVDWLPGVAIKAAGAAQVAVQQMRGPHV